jgi:hypothetical protein
VPTPIARNDRPTKLAIACWSAPTSRMTRIG